MEINDLVCACKELKKKQGLSEDEVNRLKDSIKEYVFKIKEVEDTLCVKVFDQYFDVFIPFNCNRYSELEF